MLWQVLIPQDMHDKKEASVTVEAENWFSALQEGLEKHGVDGKVLSNLTCNINPDRSVTVTDSVSRRVYTLTPMDADGSGNRETGKAVVSVSEADTASSTVDMDEKDTDYLPLHKVFFTRDEEADDGSGIFYRERLIEVEPGFSTTLASQLAHFYFGKLRELGSNNGSKLYITVHIFDHAFKKRSKRPAVAALTWKEWSPKKPKIVFPLSGRDGLNLSKVPRAPFVPKEKPLEAKLAKPREKPLEAKLAKPREKPLEAKLAKPKEKPLEVKPSKPKEKPPKMESAKPEKEVVALPTTDVSAQNREPLTSWNAPIEDRMVGAFERMQEIYKERHHDNAAAFALKLSREFIGCEAGSCMLITPGNYELYISAVEGSVSTRLRGKTLSLTEGIVGFCTRNGTVVNVSDPENDARYNDSFNILGSSKTRNILCAPVQFEGRTIGAIELRNSLREEGFQEAEANILSYLSGALAEYIDTSLPSREKDFSDRDFMMPVRPRTLANARGGTVNRAAAANNKPAAARSSKSGIPVSSKSKKIVSKDGLPSKPSPKPNSSPPNSVSSTDKIAASKMTSSQTKKVTVVEKKGTPSRPPKTSKSSTSRTVADQKIKSNPNKAKKKRGKPSSAVTERN